MTDESQWPDVDFTVKHWRQWLGWNLEDLLDDDNSDCDSIPDEAESPSDARDQIEDLINSLETRIRHMKWVQDQLTRVPEDDDD